MECKAWIKKSVRGGPAGQEVVSAGGGGDIESRRADFALALGATALLALFVGLRFDYFYDLNDDVLMKDILSGAYTGTPEGRNIQMLWGISFPLSLLYRMAGTLPWYGLFLCACHYGCFFLILRRSLSFAQTLRGKALLGVVEGMLFGGLFLSHLVFAQYTLTCTLLGAAAAFLFYTTDIRLGSREFIRRNIPAALLVVLAYLIRTEMLLLVLPMICVAGVAKWGSEERIFTGDHAVKYFSVIGLILLGILLGEVSHRIACGSREWRRFTEFFNNRTELYDFQQPPAYEEHKEFYESIGLSESEKELFDNYNFGMDEEIDEVMVGRIARYAAENKSAGVPFGELLVKNLRAYAYRLTHGPGTGADFPWNYGVILGYLLALLAGIFSGGQDENARRAPDHGAKRPLQAGKPGEKGAGGRRKYLGNAFAVLWKLALLFGVRTGLWMFILMRGRDPERITHSLYLMELIILTALLLTQWQRIGAALCRRLTAGICLALFGALSLAVWPGSLTGVLREQERREAVNAPYQELYGYLAREAGRDNFYLIDVYSTVSYSEKMFADVDNSLDNYDIMGGWACKSPLQRKKLSRFGIDSMEQALREREDVFFVRKTDQDMEWLPAYYEGHGTPVEICRVDTVAEMFEIYAVRDRTL